MDLKARRGSGDGALPRAGLSCPYGACGRPGSVCGPGFLRGPVRAKQPSPGQRPVRLTKAIFFVQIEENW